MTTVESSSERQVAKENDCGGEGIDRLSTLPDSILLHILSFLPTKTTVQTITLVSQRYRFLWKDLQVFHFFHSNRKSFKRFSDLVNGVFTHRTSSDIRKMNLTVGLYPEEDPFAAESIETWIRAIMGPCLEELRLYTSGNLTVEIPSTLFNCTNLVSLSLIGAIHVNMQHSSALFLFPSLKILKLRITSMVSLDAPDSLEIIDPPNSLDLSGCPVLQTLEIIDYDDSICEVRVPPSLKRFRFYFYGEDGVCPYLKINARSLQYLNISTSYGETFSVVGNLQSVVEAYIDVFLPLGESESVNRVWLRFWKTESGRIEVGRIDFEK